MARTSSGTKNCSSSSKKKPTETSFLEKEVSAGGKRQTAAKPAFDTKLLARRSLLLTRSSMARAAAKYNKVATKPGSKVQNGTTKAKAVALLKAKKTQTDIIKSAFITCVRKTLKLARNPNYPRKYIPTINCIKYIDG
ncbi:uncharacterized protein LOC119603170 [Lucilia sericata]|uniref:uncharacterized protein LOC119603170 n=1 Tax=Lucilia sericata TaxID=13632 RepID=UPI0018A81365|nr:uncharacterized protein LOC119603170 [Lucilia sericata]